MYIHNNLYTFSVKFKSITIDRIADTQCKGKTGYCKRATAVCIYVNTENIYLKSE